ncbi:hypothetical protein A9Q87_10840 [Flavobacteriales bacterium 34_180_T64]|nr:hypothetical protein A9Q87_10840 [Flavobacteriales bacterium 34_180_T64]
MECLFIDFIALIKRVTIGSYEHLIPISLVLFFGVIFIRYSIRNFNLNQQQKSIHYVAVLVALTVIIFHLYYIATGNYNITTDLPLYLCSFLALLIPIFTYYRTYWMYEILVFWIIAGTLQGVITPDIAEGFPSFDYFRYWMVHLGLLYIIFYATFVFNMRPKFRSIFKSILALQVYVVLMVLINFVLDANYFYLNQKPEAASLLDYFGEWPYYIFVCQLILLPYFMIIYLPFYVMKRKLNSKN